MSDPSDPLIDREILLGVCGGVAAYKSADLASKLVQAGARVSVVMTENASRFIGATTFEALTNRPVNTAPFAPREHFLGEHIGLPRRADLLIIAPATANMLSKLAGGIADDLLSTAALASTGPLLAAPAMNVEMWNKAPVQRNVEQLKRDGWELIEPEEGWLSCGQRGSGRMADPPRILEVIREAVRRSPGKS